MSIYRPAPEDILFSPHRRLLYATMQWLSLQLLVVLQHQSRSLLFQECSDEVVNDSLSPKKIIKRYHSEKYRHRYCEKRKITPLFLSCLRKVL